MPRQRQDYFFLDDVIQLEAFTVENGQVKVGCRQLVLLFVFPGHRRREAFAELDFDRQLHRFQTTATGNGDSGRQLPA